MRMNILAGILFLISATCHLISQEPVSYWFHALILVGYALICFLRAYEIRMENTCCKN
jgi:hypothetical protein